ncbi:MAG: TonB-dependent receptor plug domain-containing protein [Saprospiraceae bacterium]
MKLKNTLYTFTFSVIILFNSYNVFSQYKVTGQIVEKSTGTALSFANLKYNDNNTISDINGIFEFNSSSKELSLEITYLGFNKYLKSYNLTEGENDLGKIEMTEDSKSLNEVTITSGKFKRAIDEVTVSMESLKPDFVEKNNTINFEDLLEKIPGVSFVDGQANIRGGSGFSYGAGSRVLVLYDNIPALQFDSAFPNWSIIPTETIEKVEVMKGAGSALYGSSAMNGVINILSKYAKKTPYFKYKTHYTFYDAPSDPQKKWWSGMNPNKYGITTVFAQKIKKWDIVSSLFLEDEPKGYMKDCYNQIGRVTAKFDYHVNDALTIGLHTNLNAESKVTFYYWLNDEEGAYVGTDDSYSYQSKKVAIVDPVVTYIGKKGIKHILQSRIYYVSNYVDKNKSNYSVSGYGEYQFQKNFSDIDLVITSGIEQTRSRTDAELYGDTIFLATNTGLYIQAEKKFFDKLNLSFGARYEINSVQGPKSH